jgi:hypothetical protein
MLVHSPLDPRAEVGQELNRRLGGGVFVGIESVHAALNQFECPSLRGWVFFFFAIEFFHVIELFFYVTCFVPAALRERIFLKDL